MLVHWMKGVTPQQYVIRIHFIVNEHGWPVRQSKVEYAIPLTVISETTCRLVVVQRWILVSKYSYAWFKWRLSGRWRYNVSLRSKRFQSSYSRKLLRAEAKKGLKGDGFVPLPLPRHSFFFCSCPSFLDEPREETLATQASTTFDQLGCGWRKARWSKDT